MAASEFYRKMKLVDEAELERLIEKRIKQYDPTTRAMSKLQIEMANIVDRPDITPEEKLTLFKTANQRFQHLHSPAQISQAQQAMNNLLPQSVAAHSFQAPALNDTMNSSDIGLEEQEAGQVEDERTASTPMPARMSERLQDKWAKAAPPEPKIPHRHLAKFHNLDQLIAQNSEVIKPNPHTGEIIVDGRIIPNSNFAALAENLYSEKSGHNLAGYQDFVMALKKIFHSDKGYISAKRYIINKKVLEHINEPESGRKAHGQTGKGTHPPGRPVKMYYLYSI